MEQSFDTGVSGKFKSSKMDTILSQWLHHIMKVGSFENIVKDLNLESYLVQASDEEHTDEVDSQPSVDGNQRRPIFVVWGDVVLVDSFDLTSRWCVCVCLCVCVCECSFGGGGQHSGADLI